jgi:hypothetical protein
MNAAWGINLAVVVVVAGSCYTNVFNRLDTSTSIQQKMLDTLDLKQTLDLKHLSQLRTEMDEPHFKFHASDQQFGQLWHVVSEIKTRVDGMWEQGQYDSQKHIPNKVRPNDALVVTTSLGSNKGQVPPEIDPKYVIAVADFLKKLQDTSGEGNSGGSAPNTNAVPPKQEEGGWFWSFVNMLAKAIGFIIACMIAFYFVAFAEEEYVAFTDYHFAAYAEEEYVAFTPVAGG